MMNCRDAKRNIYLWLDGVIGEPSRMKLEEHLEQCPFCKREARSIQKFNELFKMSHGVVEPSLDFDAIFWKKVSERAKEPRLVGALRSLKSLIPAYSLSQTFAVFLIALLIGGGGGIISTVNALFIERIQTNRVSIQSLSGFQEYKGIPSPSVAAAYLKSVDERNLL